MAEYSICRRMYYQSWQGVADSPNTLEQMCELFVSTGLDTASPNISILLKVSVILPVSNAGVERSFSRLKLIKTYLRSTMSQERLSNLSLLSIELVDSLKYDCNEVFKCILVLFVLVHFCVGLNLMSCCN